MIGTADLGLELSRALGLDCDGGAGGHVFLWNFVKPAEEHALHVCNSSLRPGKVTEAVTFPWPAIEPPPLMTPVAPTFVTGVGMGAAAAAVQELRWRRS